MGDIVRCRNGHYYDQNKFRECPYCSGEIGNIGKTMPHQYAVASSVSDDGDDGKTLALNRGPTPVYLGGTGGINVPHDPSEDGVTISFFAGPSGAPIGTGPCCGWLVSKSQNTRGRDYTIRHGVNEVGSDPNNNICIQYENNIAPIKHCAIIYDGRHNQFYVRPEDGNTVYLNGETVIGAQKLKLGDEIQIGTAVLEFVPYCREGHKWD